TAMLVDVETLVFLDAKSYELRTFIDAYLPLLDLIHYVLCALAVREDFGWRWNTDNPVISWFFTVTRSLAGVILSNVLLGVPPLISGLMDATKLTKITVIWLVIFYSPRDFCYSSLEPRSKTRHVFLLLKEVQRAHKVYIGWIEAPTSDSFTKFISAAKGAGNGLIRNIQQIAVGTGTFRTTNEFFNPSPPAKIAILSALAFTFLDVNRNLTYLVVVHAAIALKAAAIAGKPIFGLN
ncbi:hypothetical protein PFISCL1PPCAC_28220, partial [Pristionchus fissidentatus]